MNRDNQDAWGHSLRTLSWDKNPDISKSQKLISDTVHEWYDAKHPSVKRSEVQFLNSLPVNHCPICGSGHFIRYGFYKDGTRCYRCAGCGHKFSVLTGTIFQDRKIPISEWIEYLLYLFEFHSVSTAARDNRNAESTGRYWLIKVFAVLEGIQSEVMLEGNVYFDEMFFPVIKHKTEIVNGKKLRGISRNKICVAAGYDDHGHMYLAVEGTSKPSRKTTWEALGKHIKPESKLIHDGDNSHGILVERLHLTEEVHPTSETKGLSDKDNPLDPINNLHSLAKRYMRAHGGYNRDNLQDWMNLIWFVLSEPSNRYEKVNLFIRRAIVSPHVVKFRDAIAKKSAD